MDRLSATPPVGRLDCLKEKDLLARVSCVAEQGTQAITDRLAQLEREWTTGRLVKATTGVALMAGLALTALGNPWWLLLVAAAGVILVQYWFFPHSWLAEGYQRLGFRSGGQIEDERLALRVLRGDFRHLPTVAEIVDRDAVSRMEGEGGPAIDDDEVKYDAKEATARVLEQTR